MAWITNDIDPTLHGNISHASTPCGIWIDLEERLAQINASQIWRIIFMMQKESDMSVTEYYTQFKSIFEEPNELLVILECNYGASKYLTKRDEDQHVHLFLGGLNNNQFTTIKGTIITLILYHHCDVFQSNIMRGIMFCN